MTLPLEADEAWETVTELEGWLVTDADLTLEPGEEGTLRLPDGEERRAVVEVGAGAPEEARHADPQVAPPEQPVDREPRVDPQGPGARRVAAAVPVSERRAGGDPRDRPVRRAEGDDVGVVQDLAEHRLRAVLGAVDPADAGPGGGEPAGESAARAPLEGDQLAGQPPVARGVQVRGGDAPAVVLTEQERGRIVEAARRGRRQGRGLGEGAEREVEQVAPGDRLGSQRRRGDGERGPERGGEVPVVHAVDSSGPGGRGSTAALPVHAGRGYIPPPCMRSRSHRAAD